MKLKDLIKELSKWQDQEQEVMSTIICRIDIYDYCEEAGIPVTNIQSDEIINRMENKFDFSTDYDSMAIIIDDYFEKGN